MRTYRAGLNGMVIIFEAQSLYAAKCHAVKVLKPKKGQESLVWVVLADVPLDPASL